MKKKWLIPASLLLIAAGITAYMGMGLQDTNGTQPAQVAGSSRTLPYLDDTTYPAVDSHASYDKLYSDTEHLNKDSNVVALVKVKNQKFVGDPGSVETFSDVEVEQVLKGDPALKELTIIESGGVVDSSQIQATGKPSVGTPQQQGRFEVVREGSPVIKTGHAYVVFLKKSTHGYVITGSIQGKIRIDEERNIGVTTVQADALKEGNKFFLQKQFANKNKDEIMDSIKKLQK